MSGGETRKEERGRGGDIPSQSNKNVSNESKNCFTLSLSTFCNAISLLIAVLSPLVSSSPASPLSSTQQAMV